MTYTPAPNPSSLRPVRWLVRHYHDDVTPAKAPREDVVTSYHASIKQSLSYAINTASRYEGTLYAELEEGDPYVFVRTYRPLSRRATEGGRLTTPVLASS